MKTISGPVGLPQSCAEIVSPSGVFTQTCLNFLSCAMVGTALAVRMKAAIDVPARWRTKDRCVMANGPPFVFVGGLPVYTVAVWRHLSVHRHDRRRKNERL